MVTPLPPGDGRVLARRYHLLRVLGRGAMGAVWEAEDTVLRRPVAVKEVVLPGGLSPEERAVSCERTLREARAIARLGHPNVVTLFDVLDEDARPWVVMELVPSRSLADVIKEDGPLHPLRVATVGLAILGALEAAHAAGITHRDVKPGNILLGHDGRVKLTDFGIARAAGDDTITGTGLLVGSPSYIAPEIVKGQGTGPAADLWGLGATLYAAVEGRAPFSGGDAMDTLSKVVQDPPAPYERAGALRPTLGAMLEKDPTRRATPVEARRLLLDVLRGGADAEQAAVRAPAPPTSAPSPAPGATLGPALADLLVPVKRRSTDPDFGFPPAGGGIVGPAGLAASAAGLRPAPASPAPPPAVEDDPDPDEEITPDTGTAATPAGATAAGATAAGATAAGATAAGATAAGATAAGATAAGVAGAERGEARAESVVEADTGGEPGPTAPAEPVEAGTTAPAEPVDTGATAPAEAVEAGPTAAFEPVDAGPTTAFTAVEAGPTAPAEPVEAGPTTVFEPVEAGPTTVFEPVQAGPTTVLRPAPARPGLFEHGAERRPAPEDDLRTELFTHGGGVPADPDEPTQVVERPAFDSGSPAAAPPAWAPAPAAREPGGPLGFGGERPREDRRRRNAAALLAVAALVLVAVLGAYLLARGLRGNGPGGTAGRTPTAAPTAADTPQEVPAGSRLYEGDGFSIGVPEGWQVQQGRDGVVDVKEPGTSRFLRLITVGASRSTALAQLTAAEDQFSARDAYDPYERVKLAKVDYRDYDAAEWEFRFRLQGQQRHVVYRGVVTGGRSYGLYLSAPEAQWADSAEVLKVAVDTFRPGA